MALLARTRSRGFSLIELMIAMLLGLILSAGIIQVFLANRQSQRIEQTVARLQENGRIALDILTQDMRMAGYFGCASPVKLGAGNILVSTPQVAIKMTGPTVSTNADAFIAQSLRGFQKTGASAWSPALPTTFSLTDVASARVGSDVVSAYYAQDDGARVSGTFSGSQAIVATFKAGACFAKNDIAMIASCKSLDLIKVTNVTDCGGATVTLQHDSSGNLDGLLGTASEPHDYSSTTASGVALSDASAPRVMQFVQSTYYVKDTTRKRPDNSAIYSLYRYRGGASEELIEGVEFLKVEFGESLPSGNIRYVSSGDAAIKMENIVAIRIGVLVQSYDTVRDAADTNVYNVADQPIGTTGAGATHAADHTLRQAYTTTIELRNRMQ